LKPWEFRRDDRDPRFEVGDLLILEEWDGAYTSRKTCVLVKYVVRLDEIGAPGFVCMTVTKDGVEDALSDLTEEWVGQGMDRVGTRIEVAPVSKSLNSIAGKPAGEGGQP